MSDVRLDGEFVIAERNWTKLRTLDLMLDAPSRRSSSVGDRRALVHDTGESRVVSVHGTDLMLDAPTRHKNTTPLHRTLVHDFHDGLTLNCSHTGSLFGPPSASADEEATFPATKG